MDVADYVVGILKKHDVKATFFLANEKTKRGDYSLDDSWTEYCTGSSYKLEYVSGSKLAVGALPSTVDMMALYIDKNKFNNAG